MHIRDVSLTLQHGSLNVLLGPTLSGKTSLMRLMAGLDVPTSGSVWFDGKDVTGMPVQKRNVAMVYQQFINYPAMTVYENIASPLRVAGTDQATIDRKCASAAELLKLTPYLDRTPLNLSGGQQQRTALARAIVKNASLVLLDEPLANLDYKLREELRAELPKIFAAAGTIFVYATTEPHEALLLGGNTATLSRGPRHPVRADHRGLPQAGRSRHGQDLCRPAAQHHRAGQEGSGISCSRAASNLPVPADLAGIADAHLHDRLPAAPSFARRGPTRDAVAGAGARSSVTEITGSESFVHLDFADARWVMLAHGIHDFEPDADDRGVHRSAPPHGLRRSTAARSPRRKLAA